MTHLHEAASLFGRVHPEGESSDQEGLGERASLSDAGHLSHKHSSCLLLLSLGDGSWCPVAQALSSW